MTTFRDTIDWYNSHANEYAILTQHNYQEERIKKFIALLTPHARILDAGCASGRDSKVLSERGLVVTGIDISEKLIDIARKYVPNAAFDVGNFSSLPYQDSYFDGIWAHASLVHMEYITDVKKSLKEFHRILKPGGLLYLFVRGKKQPGQTTVMDGRFYRYFSEGEITDLLIETGFIIQKRFMEKEHDRPERKPRDITWITIYAIKNEHAL